MKPFGWLMVGMGFSWALVSAADARHEQKPVETAYQVVMVDVEVEVPVVPEPKPTPIADGLVDWAEVERQTDCLWVYLRKHFGHDITLDRVLAAGYWTDELGGACQVIGEDDE